MYIRGNTFCIFIQMCTRTRTHRNTNVFCSPFHIWRLPPLEQGWKLTHIHGDRIDIHTYRQTRAGECDPSRGAEAPPFQQFQLWHRYVNEENVFLCVYKFNLLLSQKNSFKYRNVRWLNTKHYPQSLPSPWLVDTTHRKMNLGAQHFTPKKYIIYIYSSQFTMDYV